MKFNLPKPYLSASAINSFIRCQMQYKFRYIDGIILPPNASMLGGSAVHAGNEGYFQDILDGGSSRMTPAMVAELAQVSMEEMAVEQNCPLEGEYKDVAMKEVAIASASYIENIGQYTEPLAVEEEIHYMSRCGVDILGYIDLSRAPYPHEVGITDAVIVDYKFTGKKMALPQVENSLQFHLYAMATEVMDIEVHNIVRSTKPSKTLPKGGGMPGEPVQDKASNIRVLHHRFRGDEFDHIENMIEATATAISAGNFIPCDMGAWNCNDKWCGYWHLCRGRGRPV